MCTRLGPPWWDTEAHMGAGGGYSLGKKLELVWARILVIAGVAGQLECPDPSPVCTIKVEGNVNNGIQPAPLFPERVPSGPSPFHRCSRVSEWVSLTSSLFAL